PTFPGLSRFFGRFRFLASSRDVQPNDFANYFSIEASEDVLIAYVRLLLPSALLAVGRCDYIYRVFDGFPNPFSGCLAAFTVIKIHIDDDCMNLIVVFLDFLKQWNRNNAAIENSRIKPLYSVFLFCWLIRCSHGIDAMASRHGVQQRGVITSRALQQNA